MSAPISMSTPIRYFVAALLPDHAKNQLIAAQPHAAPGVRLLTHRELHLTLQYLGEVNSPSEVATALASVSMKTFRIAVRGNGAFPSEANPEVLWAGVERASTLSALHDSIGACLNRAVGFQPEARTYSPHVTLARLNRPCSDDTIERYLKENKEFRIPSIPIRHFALYSSRFVSGIPEYEEQARFDLL